MESYILAWCKNRDVHVLILRRRDSRVMATLTMNSKLHWPQVYRCVLISLSSASKNHWRLRYSLAVCTWRRVYTWWHSILDYSLCYKFIAEIELLSKMTHSSSTAVLCAVYPRHFDKMSHYALFWTFGCFSVISAPILTQIAVNGDQYLCPYFFKFIVNYDMSHFCEVIIDMSTRRRFQYRRQAPIKVLSRNNCWSTSCLL